MTRMDSMRKVLYGGYRSTDGDAVTVLERSYIPQDAHSWGKEYESEARDGYKITDYTPLSQPALEPAICLPTRRCLVRLRERTAHCCVC